MSIYFPVAVILFALIPSVAVDPTGQNSNRSAKDAAKTKEIKSLFKQHCAKCHGTDGRGKTVDGEIKGAQDFTDKDWRERVADERLVNSITYGRGQMPAFGKKLSKEQIKSLAEFALTFKP